MKNNSTREKLTIGAILLTHFALPLSAQSVFQNLNFENAVTPLIIDEFKEVATSDAVPGWTVYSRTGLPASRMFFDTVSLGDPRVSLQSSDSIWGPPIQGHFTVLLQAANFGFTTVAIGQVGQIPADASSLRFYGRMSLEVTFAGHPLSLIKTGSGLTYDQIGADISPFAGQTGELKFTASNMPVSTFIYLDAIHFSTVTVPEPEVITLLALGAAVLGGISRRTKTL